MTPLQTGVARVCDLLNREGARYIVVGATAMQPVHVGRAGIPERNSEFRVVFARIRKLPLHQSCTGEAVEKEPRKAPRFSITRLAEYMTASASRRRALIQEQINPSTFKVVTYDAARRAVARAVQNGAASPEELRAAALTLREKSAAVSDTEPHQAECLKYSALALESFATHAHLLCGDKAIAVSTVGKPASIALGELRVSVAPDVTFLERGTERRVGGIRLNVSRSALLRADGLQYVATAVALLLESQGESPVRRLCLAADMFDGTVVDAPRAMKTRKKDLSDAAAEIVSRWPDLYNEAHARWLLRGSRK
ncbi:MAG: hypothetical protein IT355_16450 [Gemmatimonadaceae bacterium]|nr:hypothetical protein [Gemmatimonadaceae bacterium]